MANCIAVSAETSSAAAGITPVVGAAAAALWVAIAVPIPRKSAAAAASISGCVVTKDMALPPLEICRGPAGEGDAERRATEDSPEPLWFCARRCLQTRCGRSTYEASIGLVPHAPQCVAAVGRAPAARALRCNRVRVTDVHTARFRLSAECHRHIGNTTVGPEQGMPPAAHLTSTRPLVSHG